MALLTAPDEPEMLATDSLATPVLRLSQRGAERHRIVPLPPGKCTIGSSPQCQVCLPTPEVRPLQCLITLESDVASVTRWATGVQLNGNEFSKAELKDGDRLTIGDWLLEFDRGGLAPEVAPAEFDDQELSSEAALESPSEWTPEIASDVDEQPEEPDSLVDVPTASTPVADLPADLPIADEVTPVADGATPVAATSLAPAEYYSSHAFADSLVLHLWTANDRARRRAKSLITSIRAARFQADALAADLSAIETELDLARAAYDSHLGNDDRLQQELARQHEQRVAPLVEEIAALQFELEQAHAHTSRQTVAYDALCAELAALRTASKSPAADPALAKRAEELQAAVVIQPQEWEPTVNCNSAAALAISEQVPASDNLWPDVAPTVEEPAQTLALAAWNTFTPQAVDPSSPPRQDASAAPEPIPAPPAPMATLQQAPEAEAPALALVPEEPPAEYTSPSFIDKYRHLLESDEAHATQTLALKGICPVIDDEFLSPAKVETCASPSDESDEALEAYMANMMRRVRSSSPSHASSQAPPIDEPKRAATRQMQHSVAAEISAASAAAPEFLAEEPFSFEAMKHATRKPALASDLTALREIANNSARTAIASHGQRRSHESAVTKIAIALTAAASAAYLMASAPAIADWQFWAGAGAGAAGVTAAVQVLLLERRVATSVELPTT